MHKKMLMSEVYSRYIYSERRYTSIPGISAGESQVYHDHDTMDIEILLSWIYGQVNAVSQNND